jgi:hypothetical protein
MNDQKNIREGVSTYAVEEGKSKWGVNISEKL